MKNIVLSFIVLSSIIVFSTVTHAQADKIRMQPKVKMGQSFMFAIKCMKNGDSALDSGDSNNFNIAEFNGEFKESSVEYWTEKDNSVSKRTLSTDKIIDVTPINDQGCFIIKFKA
jgi:hypothetical protein